MARGGGHEDLDKALAATNELIADIDRLNAAEASYQGQVNKGVAADDDAARARRAKARATSETVETETRAARAARASTEATKMDTAAIKANTEARQRANRVTAMQGRAVAGARSPQYAEAYRIMQEQGAVPSQYRLRQLPGVGQRRAAAMVEAMRAGLVPAPTSGGAAATAMTRVQAAHESVAVQEYKLAQATEEYARLRRKGTEEEAKAQYATRERLKAELKSSRRELTDAEAAQTAAMERNRLAIQADTEARQRVAETARRVAREGLAGQPGPLGLPAPGQTVQGMPVGLAQTRTRAYVPDWATGSRSAEAIAAARAQGEAIGREIRGLLPAPGQTVQGMPVVPPEVRTRVTGTGGIDWTKGDPTAPARAARAATEAAARQAEAEGRLADAARIYNDELNNPARARALQMSDMAAQYADRQAAATLRSAQAYQQAAAGFYPLSQAMHRHGALTSEFIAAAARGETTLKELGNQAVITAGKFAGWTVAAAGVYGVLGALQQVGQGAMDASSGADQAFRVITEGQDRDKIQGEFADLSRTFNVPINDAADAVYRMGQVFHNQADAVEAAKASLLSYKTGGVSVEESTKNLIAIQRGYGLSSKELIGIFDQINQAQNVFGASIGTIESGLARAGGTWKNAGGDLSYLLAIMVAVQKATGESGNVIGTPFSRLYYVQHPENAQKLKDLGVDVDTTNAQSTFQSIMEQARLHPENIQALASGFAGNQYARLFTGMLSDQKTFNDALRETGAEASKGSGFRELDKILGQVDEQIAQIGNSLQRLGEELGRAGAFTFLGLMLKAVNGTLQAAELLLGVFNMLPGPLRQGVMLIGQMAIGVALLRKLGATERLVNTPFGALADPAGRQRTHTIVGLRQGQQEAYNRMERLGQIDVDAAHRFDVAQRQAADALEARNKTLHLDVEHPDRMRAEQNYLEASQRASRAETELRASTKNLQTAREVAAHAEEELATAQRTNRRQFESVARQRNWVQVNKLDQPNTAGISGPGTTASGIILPAGYGRGASKAAADIDAATKRATADIASASGKMDSALSRWGMSAALLGRGTGNARALAGRAATGLRSAGTALRGLAVSIGAALGPLDWIIIGVIAIVTAAGKLAKVNKEADRVRNSLTAETTTDREIREQEKTAREILDKNARVGNQTAAPSRNIGQQATLNFLNNVTSYVTDLPGHVGKWWRDYTGQTQAAEDAIRLQEQREAAQAMQAAKGKPRPQLTYDQIIKDIDDDAKKRKAGIISQQEFDRRQANHAVEIQTMLGYTKKLAEQAKQKMAEAKVKAGGSSYGEGLVLGDNELLTKEMQGTAAAIELYGLTPHNIEYLKAQYQAAEQKYRNSRTPEALQALNAARQAYFSAIQQEVQKELQLDLLQAGNEQQRRAAYRKASAAYDKMRITFKEQNSRTREKFKQEREELKRKQQLEDQGGYRHQQRAGEEGQQDPQGGTYDPSDAEVKKREDRQRRERIKLNREQRKKMDKELARQNRELTIAQLELKQAAYDDRAQGRDILLNLQISETRDPARQAALRVRMAEKQVADAEREWGTQSRQYRQALTGLNNARMQQADAILAGVQADNALLLAQAGSDPVNRARVEAENAQRELDSMRKNGADPNAIKEGQARVIDARRAAKDAADQQMQDLARLRGELAAAQAGGDPVLEARAAVEAAQLARKVADTPVERLQALVDLAKANNALRDAIAERERARYDLLRSMTDDPVERARLDMEEARNALKGTKGYDRMKKQADYNNAKRAWQEAQIDSRADDINWRLQMDQITNEEAAKQLEELAKVKGISEQKKRDLLLQAKQLRDQASGDYELDVGDVRLPTLYEVKRYVNGGKEAVTAGADNVTDNRTFTVYLQTAEAVNAFAQQLELTNGTAAKATALSMMMR